MSGSHGVMRSLQNWAPALRRIHPLGAVDRAVPARPDAASVGMDALPEAFRDSCTPLDEFICSGPRRAASLRSERPCHVGVRPLASLQ